MASWDPPYTHQGPDHHRDEHTADPGREPQGLCRRLCRREGPPRWAERPDATVHIGH